MVGDYQLYRPNSRLPGIYRRQARQNNNSISGASSFRLNYNANILRGLGALLRILLPSGVINTKSSMRTPPQSGM